MNNKKLIVLQDGNKECGSACLLSIIRYYGGDISINRLVELTNTTKEGTNFLCIKNACHELGLNALGYKIDDKNNLLEIDKPFIAQININNYLHFVVVYKIKNNKLYIMDPAKGRVVIQLDQFMNIWTSYILIITPYKKLEIYKSKKVLNEIIIEVLSKNRKLILNILFLSIIFTIISCISTYYFQITIDNVIDNSYYNLVIIFLIFIVMAVYKSLTSYCRNYLIIYLNQKLDLTLIINTINKILLLPYNYYKNKTTGEIITRVNDIANIKNILTKLIISIFLDFLICLVSGIILFNINSTLFIILLIVTLGYFMITIVFNKIIKKMININQINNAKVNSLLVETINGFETIKGLHLEKLFISKFEKLYIKSLNDNLEFEKISNIINFQKELISGITSVLIIFIGSKLVLDNSLKLSSLITFNFLFSYYIEPIKNILDVLSEFHLMKNSIKRANNLFEVDTIDAKETNLLVNGNIRVNNLSFNYTNKLVLDKVNFSIKDAEKVLLIGNSGSGKSTILKLIFKYYKIDRDSIYINNYDINDYTINDIRNNISYISQNELLFNDSIKNNIILDSNTNYEDFLRVVKLTYVDEIIKDDILGYDKVLEENAVNLSGGQRQRIILARTLLKSNKIILIDEGLNEIDIDMERKILKNIFYVYRDRTIIIVSHRLNNMDLFDKVLKINDNKIDSLERNKSYE